MADNITAPAQAGIKIATDELPSNDAHAQFIKIMDGTLQGEDKVAASAANGLEVDVTRVQGTVTTDGSGVTQPVSGTVTANLGTTDNAVLDQIELNQDSQTALLTTIDADTSKIPAQGQALAAASMPVVLPEAQITALTPPAAISGFATSAKQDTIIGHVDGVETLLGTIDADTSALAGAVAGTEVQVDVVSSALPTGAATAAKQPALGTAGTASTDVISVQGIASMTPLIVDLGANNDVTVTGSVTADLGANNDVTVTSGAITETNSGAIKTAVETIDNAISGTEMQVDVVAALPAGTNAIGKLAANSGVDIGDVDVTSLPAIPAGTNAIGKILPPDIDITAHANYIRKYYTSTGAATDGIIWSPASGKRWHITSLYFQVSADATVTFEDDKSGGDDPVLKGEYKAGSGIALTFDEKYPFASGEDAADLTVTTSAGNIYVTVIGYEV